MKLSKRSYRDDLDQMNNLLLDPFEIKRLLEGSDSVFQQTGELDVYRGIRVYLNHRLVTYKQWFTEDFPLLAKNTLEILQYVDQDKEKNVIQNIAKFDHLALFFLRNYVPSKRNRFEAPIEFIGYWSNEHVLLGAFLALDFTIGFLQESTDCRTFEERLVFIEKHFKENGLGFLIESFESKRLNLRLPMNFEAIVKNPNYLDHRPELKDTLFSIGLEGEKLILQFWEEKA